MRFQVLLLLDKINRKLSYEGFVTYPSEKGLIVNRGFHHSLSTEVNPANDLIFMHYRGNDEPIFKAIRLKVNNGIKHQAHIYELYNAKSGFTNAQDKVNRLLDNHFLTLSVPRFQIQL